MKYALAVVMGLMVTAASPAGALTKCDLTFTLEGWSVFYKEAHGSGVVRCDNGQRAAVRLETRGGGLTFGRSKIVSGSAEFSRIVDIAEIFGNYANVEAHAGMGVSAGAQVVTKGSVSLALSGTGNGVDIGVAFGRFTIARSAHQEPTEGRRDGDGRDERIRDEDLPAAAAPEQGY
ncbi:MAG: hypothetical protein H6Q34_626 [Deltaproteobacteria bacterium]|nr:hypothetical protein [Deltaproteobacteria bacterium]